MGRRANEVITHKSITSNSGLKLRREKKRGIVAVASDTCVSVKKKKLKISHRLKMIFYVVNAAEVDKEKVEEVKKPAYLAIFAVPLQTWTLRLVKESP